MEITRDGSAPQTIHSEIFAHGTITSSNTTLRPVTVFPLVISATYLCFPHHHRDFFFVSDSLDQVLTAFRLI
jgi:hypothetical protein